MPYIYIDRVLNELREPLLSAMHSAVERELRQGRVDVSRLFRAFSRAAAGQCSTPVRVSDKCVETGEKISKRARPPVPGERSGA